MLDQDIFLKLLFSINDYLLYISICSSTVQNKRIPLLMMQVFITPTYSTAMFGCGAGKLLLLGGCLKGFTN